MFAHQYPAHPEFETEIKPGIVRKVWAEVQKAIEAPGHRGLVADAPTRRLVRAVVNPCRLGVMGETHLLIEPHWPAHFTQCQARDGGAITVAKLRQWIDAPQPMGLLTDLQNLVILSFALLTHRSFILAGAPQEPGLDQMADHLELREQALPDPALWQTAVARAAALFGLTLPQTLNATSVARLVNAVREAARAKRIPLGELVAAVRERGERYGSSGATARQRTAESAQALIAVLCQAEDRTLVSTLALTPLETSEAAVSRTLGQAEATVSALAHAKWALFDAMRDIADHRQEAAKTILRRLDEVLAADEHVIPLKSRFDEMERDAVRLLASAAPRPEPEKPVSPPQPVPPAPPLHPRTVVVEEAQRADLSAADATRLLDELKARLCDDQALELTVIWRLQRRSE